MDDFSPLEALERSFHNWWLVVLLVVWGGVVGWLIHSQQPPIYEAGVLFYTSVDFKQTGKLDLIEEDRAIGLVGTLIISGPVIQQVADAANHQGIPVDIYSLRKMAFLSRKSYQWDLRIRNPDPGVAQALANLWADRALATLKEDFKHAQQAVSLRAQLDNIYRCSAAPPTQALPAFCQSNTPAQLYQAASELTAEYQNELILSGGMSPALLFDLTERASRPLQPVVLGTNSMVLAGGFTGFLFAVWAIAGDWPARLSAWLQTVRRHG
jgi:hypothetical protein